MVMTSRNLILFVQNGIEILQRAEKSIYAHSKLLHYSRNYTEVFHDPERVKYL